jgi:tRNA threonylcarbamoyladenosine biosynthesis protein TsaB
MRVLALDTTTRAGSLAIVEAGRIVFEIAGDPTRTHAERLPREIVEALASIGRTSADVDLFAVASGPGSFTGLRIGIATIQGLALVHGKRVAPISALRALAESAVPGLAIGQRVGAWMDAYRRDIFSALYEVILPADQGIALLNEVEGPVVGPPGSALERWNRIGMPARVCGDGVTLYRSLLPDGVEAVAPPLLASTIGRLAVASYNARETVPPAGIQPLYVRRPDVEITRDAGRRPPA